MAFPRNYPLARGNLFYKYRGDLGPNRRNLDLVTKQEAYFASTTSFNDPFDCAPASGPSNVEELRNLITVITSDSRIPSEMREGYRREFSKHSERFLNITQDEGMTEKYFKDFVDEYSIFCLSTNPLNRLLWSHYGGNHYGFAVELEIPFNIGLPPQESWCPEHDNFFPLKVRYSETRPKLGMTQDFDIDLFLKKDQCWSYEDEARIINRGKPRAIKFHTQCLRSVILGARADMETEQAIIEAVDCFNQDNSTNALVHRAKMSKTDYLLTIPDHPFFNDRQFDEVPEDEVDN